MSSWNFSVKRSCVRLFVSTMGGKIVWLCFWLANFLTVAETLTAYYIPSPCGTTLTLGTDVTPLSLQLESDKGLVYANNVDCVITIGAPANQLVLAIFKRFELEPSTAGSCLDYVSLHDGRDVSSAALSNDVCGGAVLGASYVTTSSAMTLHFVTDSTAVYHGFNILFTAVTTAPCGTDQSACNNSYYCIPSKFRCDNYDQCGDNSDESSCSEEVASSGTNKTSLIVGLTLGLVAVALFIACLVYRRYRSRRWRKFHSERIEREDLPDIEPVYPVTHRYFRGKRGHFDLQPEDKPSVGSDGDVTSAAEDEKKTAISN